MTLYFLFDTLLRNMKWSVFSENRIVIPLVVLNFSKKNIYVPKSDQIANVWNK